MTFGERVEQLAKRKNINPDELAMRLGVGLSDIVNLTGYNRTPTVQQLEMLARILDTSMDYLWTGESLWWLKSNGR